MSRRQILTVLLSVVAGFGLGRYLRPALPACATPDAITINFPEGEKRDYHTFVVIPGNTEDAEPGLWFVTLRNGERITTQYRLRKVD